MIKQATILALLFTYLLSTPLNAQTATDAQAETSAQNPARPNPLDERSGLPIPKTMLDLRNLSVTLWIKFRQTNQHVYRYINEAAQFHAYGEICKRHELNLSMAPITELARYYIQAAVPAHYDEPEFALLEPLSKRKQQDFLDDIAGDIYGFEYGFRSSELHSMIEEGGTTRKVYCEAVEEEYKLSYMALRATAKNRLPEFQDRVIPE